MSRLSLIRILDSAIETYVKSMIAPVVLNHGQYHDSIPGTEIPVNMATPDRPYGWMPLIETGRDKGDIDIDRAVKMLATPRVSITRSDFEFDLHRNNNNPVRTSLGFWDSQMKFLVQSQPVRPWNIPYQINIHSRLRRDGQNTVEPWLFTVTPYQKLLIDFCYPWGVKPIMLRFDRITDMTNLEPGEDTRIWHFVIPFTMIAWGFESFENPSDLLTNPTFSIGITRAVHRILLRYIEKSSCVVLAESTWDLVPPPARPSDEEYYPCPELLENL